MNTLKDVLTSKGFWVAIGAAIMVAEFYPRIRAKLTPAAKTA